MTTISRVCQRRCQHLRHLASGNLEKLYRALLNIAPTSVASERAFSVSDSFVSRRQKGLSNEAIVFS
jgi:hypothetical protein